jgi:hypothetical protein
MREYLFKKVGRFMHKGELKRKVLMLFSRACGDSL